MRRGYQKKAFQNDNLSFSFAFGMSAHQFFSFSRCASANLLHFNFAQIKMSFPKCAQTTFAFQFACFDKQFLHVLHQW